jgi:hypothetical protein
MTVTEGNAVPVVRRGGSVIDTSEMEHGQASE